MNIMILISSTGLDPYRFKIFEDDDEDDIEVIGGKKGGGCGQIDKYLITLPIYNYLMNR